MQNQVHFTSQEASDRKEGWQVILGVLGYVFGGLGFFFFIKKYSLSSKK